MEGEQEDSGAHTVVELRLSDLFDGLTDGGSFCEFEVYMDIQIRYIPSGLLATCSLFPVPTLMVTLQEWRIFTSSQRTSSPSSFGMRVGEKGVGMITQME